MSVDAVHETDTCVEVAWVTKRFVGCVGACVSGARPAAANPGDELEPVPDEPEPLPDVLVVVVVVGAGVVVVVVGAGLVVVVVADGGVVVAVVVGASVVGASVVVVVVGGVMMGDDGHGVVLETRDAGLDLLPAASNATTFRVYAVPHLSLVAV